MVNILTGVTIIIAIIIGVYLGRYSSKYLHGEDYKKADTPLNPTMSKKQGIIIFVIIPICIALLFVISYQRLSEKKFIDFVLFGFASVIPNMIFMFIMFYFYKEIFLAQYGGSYVLAIGYIFTLIVPFFIYFVFVSLVFFGWQIPFKF